MMLFLVLCWKLHCSNIFEGAEAKGLLLQVFLVHSMHDRLVTCAKGLSDVLQSTKLNLVF